MALYAAIFSLERGGQPLGAVVSASPESGDRCWFRSRLYKHFHTLGRIHWLHLSVPAQAMAKIRALVGSLPRDRSHRLHGYLSSDVALILLRNQYQEQSQARSFPKVL